MRVGYARQGYIYFKSLIYKDLSPEERSRIMSLCKKAGGEHHRALFEFVTTQDTATSICARHFIASPTTLHMLARKYYEMFSAVMEEEKRGEDSSLRSE